MKKSSKIFKAVFKTLLAMLAAIALAMALRVFFFATFVIPSYSMAPAVIDGDQVLVYKMIPGPRLFTNLNFLRGGEVSMERWHGCRPLRRGEIAVFNFPYRNSWDKMEMDFNAYYIKRCMGVPGDTLRIVNGFYRIVGCIDELGCPDNQSQLSQTADSTLAPEVFHTYPSDTALNWTIKQFGPLYVPRAGDAVQLDATQYILYKRVIEFETGGKLTLEDGQCHLNGIAMETYIFKKNYYFMAGDYVFDSRDSRYWGLLPEDFIVGKAILVLWSKDRQMGSIRWGRTLKDL